MARHTLTYACTYGHHRNYFVFTCYLVYIISCFVKMAETFFFVYIIDLNEQIKIIKLSQSAVAQ